MRTGDLAERLQQDIDRLAAEHEAPSFEPHVTLLGGTEQSEEDALRITAELAQSLQVGELHDYVCDIAEQCAAALHSSQAHASLHAQAYRLEFQDVSYGKIFHQCVYVRCKTTDAVMDAAKRTRQAFGHSTDTQYMPHVSLLYLDIPSESRCTSCEGRCGRDGFGINVQCVQHAPHLHRRACICIFLTGREQVAAKEQQRMFSDCKMPAYGFEVDSISLWYTIGEDKTLQSWRLVKEFALHA